MQEFEPKKRNKILTKEFVSKYAYAFVMAVLLIGGISYGYTFFVQNKKIASGSITTADLTINFTDRSISATNLSVSADDSEGITEFSKSLTITNETAIDGRVKLTLTRTNGLNLTDMRYALIIDDIIQTIDDVPSDGEILSSAIMGNEVLNVEVKLWPKSTYTGNVTTFTGELTPEIKYLGSTAASMSSPAGKYVNFNCSAGTCEVWQIVKVEDDRLVLTTQANYEGATNRTNSNRYDTSLGLHDDGNLITSTSTDGKNVYLAKTVKINGGNGTLNSPYDLINNIFHEEDKKKSPVITYKRGTTTVGTQDIYADDNNYISQVIDSIHFQGWSDGTNTYQLGSAISSNSDVVLTAIMPNVIVNVYGANEEECSTDPIQDTFTLGIYSDSDYNTLVTTIVGNGAESYGIDLAPGTYYLNTIYSPIGYSTVTGETREVDSSGNNTWDIYYFQGIQEVNGGFPISINNNIISYANSGNVRMRLYHFGRTDDGVIVYDNAYTYAGIGNVFDKCTYLTEYKKIINTNSVQNISPIEISYGSITTLQNLSSSYADNFYFLEVTPVDNSSDLDIFTALIEYKLISTAQGDKYEPVVLNYSYKEVGPTPTPDPTDTPAPTAPPAPTSPPGPTTTPTATPLPTPTPVVTSYNLIIHYIYEDGSMALSDYTTSVTIGDSFSRTSPSITGYTPDIEIVSGTMPSHDTEYTVVYIAN